MLNSEDSLLFTTTEQAVTTNEDNIAVKDVSDDPWIVRLKGEPEVRDAAIEELRSYLVRGLTKSMATRYGGGYSPDDVVQDALLKILDSLDQFAGRSRFTTWAMTVATRIGISEMRRKRYQDVSIDSFKTENDDAMDFPAEISVTASVEIDRKTMVSKLRRVIDETLTEKQKIAVQASLAGLPAEVIAAKTGSNRNSVYKLVHDARTKLRAGLEAVGVSSEELALLFS